MSASALAALALGLGGALGVGVERGVHAARLAHFFGPFGMLRSSSFWL